MAVGNPYGKGAYGTGPYARYDASRPYGMGAYGVGPYSRWGGNTFDVAGATSLTFGVSATAALRYQPGAATSIVWQVSALSPNMDLRPWAITEIVFEVQSHLAWNWVAAAPCEVGTWQPADPCSSGGWTAPPGCSPGSWTVTRLV